LDAEKTTGVLDTLEKEGIDMLKYLLQTSVAVVEDLIEAQNYWAEEFDR